MLKLDLKTILTYALGAVLMAVAIGFAMKKQSERLVRDLEVYIDEEKGNYFIDKPEAVQLINADHTDFVLGLTLDQLDLKLLERRIEEHAFVKDAQIFHDVTGTLKVTIKQAQPIARILAFGDEGRYIDAEGNLLPLNARHTARVPILEFEGNYVWENSLYENKEGKELFDLLKFIENDKFWRAQIAHIIIEKNWEVIMIPQVTKQKIVFGKPNNLEQKFSKLKLFYEEILPYKGWNTYAYVNVKFNNQIVCE